MRKIAVTLGIVAILAVSLPAWVSATPVMSLAQFAGMWANIDPNTSGITRMSIAVDGAAATVQAWGKCVPQECDWGAVPATVYGQASAANVVDSARAIVARFGLGATETLLVIHVGDADRLAVEGFTRFTDGSGSTNYDEEYVFTRGPAAPGSGPAQEQEGLAAPVQVSPRNGAKLGNFPRTTTLTWRTVAGAASYVVEVDCLDCCVPQKWCTEVGRAYIPATSVTGTHYTFTFAGMQPGRWRVSAVDSGGNAGPQSPWWTFTYTQ